MKRFTDEQLREARNEYYRRYRKNNKEKIIRSNLKYWNKQLELLKQEQEQQKDA